MCDKDNQKLGEVRAGRDAHGLHDVSAALDKQCVRGFPVPLTVRELAQREEVLLAKRNRIEEKLTTVRVLLDVFAD